MTRVLVTGGTGAVGPGLVRACLAQGHKVRVLVHEQIPRDFPSGVELSRGALDSPQTLRDAVRGMDKVFHLAGKLHVSDPPAAQRAEYWRVNVEGTRRLADAASAENVKRIVFFSTIAVYGPSRNGAELDEESPRNPDSLYAETKCAAEDVVREMGSKGVVLRMAAIYGPHMKGNYARLLWAARRGLFVPVGSGSNRRTLVHTSDAAAASLLALEHEAAAGGVLNVTDGTVHSFREILEAIYSALGRKCPRWSLPSGPAKAVAGSIDWIARLFAVRTPSLRRALDKLLEDVAVGGRRIQTRLDFRPEVDLASGWRRIVAP